MKWIKTYIIICLNIFLWIWICDINSDADFFVAMGITFIIFGGSLLCILLIFKKLK